MRVLVVLVAGLVAAVAASSASAHKADNFGCPPSFDAYTPEEAVLLERTQKAIADGLVSEQDALAGWQSLDVNGSGYVCVALPYGFEVSNRPGGEYFYNAVDDNASVASG